MPELETVPCPLCGRAQTKRLYQGDGFAMGRCTGCGLVRQNPRLTARALLVDHYDGTVQETGKIIRRPQAYEGLKSWESQPLSAYEAGVRAVEPHRRSEGSKGIWVDVGASTGSLLVAARNAGWQAVGVEPGEKQVRMCRELHRLEVVHGVLKEARWPDGFAEVVSYRQVLEHIHEPLDELAEAHRILKADGLLLVEVPNDEGLRFRWGRLRTHLGLCRPHWERLNVPEHLYYFTRRTLGTLLRKTGFELLESRTYGRIRPNRGLLRSAWDAAHHRLLLGNKLRVVARKVNTHAGAPDADVASR